MERGARWKRQTALTVSTNITLLISLSHREQLLADVRAAAPNAEVRRAEHLESPGKMLPSELMKGSDVLLCEFPPINFDQFDQLLE